MGHRVQTAEEIISKFLAMLCLAFLLIGLQSTSALRFAHDEYSYIPEVWRKCVVQEH